MIQRLGVIGIALGTALSTGCSSMNNTQKGAGIGGALGAGVGTIVGAATGNPKTGLVAGTLIGGATGALIGSDMDQKENQDAELRAASANQPVYSSTGMSIQEIIDLSIKGVSDEVIINNIRKTNSTYNLSPQDLSMLKENKVSDRVVIEMQNSQSRPRLAIQQPPPRTVIVHEPPPVVIYERPYWGEFYHRPHYHHVPPPRPGVGVGVVFR